MAGFCLRAEEQAFARWLPGIAHLPMLDSSRTGQQLAAALSRWCIDTGFEWQGSAGVLRKKLLQGGRLASRILPNLTAGGQDSRSSSLVRKDQQLVIHKVNWPGGKASVGDRINVRILQGHKLLVPPGLRPAFPKSMFDHCL